MTPRHPNAYLRLKDRYQICPVRGCWLWLLSKDKGGYGKASYDGRQWQAHRLSYFVFVSDLIDGLIICHECDNPACINPTHLTQADHSYNNSALGRIAKVSKALTGRKRLLPVPDYVREQLSISLTGKPKSIQTRERMSVYSRNRSEEHQQRLNQSQAETRRVRPRTHSEETKRKMSASRTGRTISEETREKLRLAARKREAAKRL